MAKRGYKLQEFVAHSSDVTCLAIGKKSSRIFITGGDDRKVNLWQFGKPISLLSLTGHTSSVQSLTFDSAEALVLAGSSNGVIKLWDLEEAKLVRSIPGHRSNCTAVEFHPFGEFFGSGSLDTDLKLWDIRKKGCIHTYKGHSRGIRTIRFSPDGRWVVTGGEDHVVKVWDLTAGKLLHDFKFHNGTIRCIDFHPQEFLLASGSTDRTVNFWDLETFELIGSAGPEATGVRSMVFHPDGRTLFCGLDETLKVFSWEPIRCHDSVDMGWSTLGDLSICEGNLFGCSYYQNCVGVWVADTSLIGPYAVGVILNKDGPSEPIRTYTEDHSIELKQCLTTSSLPLIAKTDCVNKIKDTLPCSSVTPNICSQSFQKEDLTSAPNTPDSNLAGFGRNNAAIGSENTSHKSRLPSKVPTLDSTAFSGSKTTVVVSCDTPNIMESSFTTREMTSRSTTSRANSRLTQKKEVVVESDRKSNSQATGIHVSTPVFIPKDSESGACSTKGAIARNTSSNKLYHMRQPSFSDDRNNSKLFIAASKPSSSPADNDLNSTDCRFIPRPMVNTETVGVNKSNITSIGHVARTFERNMSLEQPVVGLNNYTDARPPSSSGESNKVKYVRGVAVQLGKTRSLVERFEKKETSTASCTAKDFTSTEQASNLDNLPLATNVEGHSAAKYIKTDDFGCEALLQGHDVFINQVKSRLTKLQVVRHFWEHNGIKGAIDAVVKLPDYSVQVDVISVLMEKTGLFTLDIFSCLLPLLSGLLNSKIDRHAIVSLELLFELIKIFGPVIHSTMSSSSLVGVDLQAEQRLERCKKCYTQLQKIRQMLPTLIRNRGSLAKHVQKLNVALIEL